MTNEQYSELNMRKIADGLAMLSQQGSEGSRLTQDTLALFADVYPYQVSKIMSKKGGYNPSLETISKLLAVFDMDMEQFFVWYNKHNKED